MRKCPAGSRWRTCPFYGGPDLPSRGSNGQGRHVRLGATVEQCKELGIGFLRERFAARQPITFQRLMVVRWLGGGCVRQRDRGAAMRYFTNAAGGLVSIDATDVVSRYTAMLGWVPAPDLPR